MKSAKIDMAGLRFGRLLVVSESSKRLSKRVTWNCLCDCGKAKIVSGKHLRSGVIRSCGCLSSEVTAARNTTHGMSRHSAYGTWVAMIRRCEHSSNEQWQRDYRDRGIKVCDRWKDFMNFVSDMGDCPPGFTVERIDNNGNYEPANCRWATRTEQNQNMRTNRTVYVDGIAMPAREASRLFGFHHSKCTRAAIKKRITHQRVVDEWFRLFET